MPRLICYIVVLFAVIITGCRKDQTGLPASPGGQTYNHNSFPGSSASDYLGNQKYQSLRIELDYMPGFRPDPGAVELFTALLAEHINKPGGITIIEKEIDPTLKTVFTLDDINATESENRSVYTLNGQMSAYMLITNGSYFNSNVMGMAYKNTSVCFFGEPLQFFSIGTLPGDRIRAVALLFTHEFGHLLGLVDMGTPMTVPHMDDSYANHCDNTVCIMHHSFEPLTKNITRILSGPYYFDNNCISDMQGNGGR